VLPPEEGGRYEHVHVYVARHQGPVVAQESEVEAVRWLARDAFDAFVQDTETAVTPSLRDVGLWARECGHW
jgi:isopentenyldiphosphate isomerase